jgi:hypothetical protein
MTTSGRWEEGGWRAVVGDGDVAGDEQPEVRSREDVMRGQQQGLGS